jgi:uncharacterized Ntn-hydrolase superfamily protein
VGLVEAALEEAGTQSMVNPAFGPGGLALLRDGSAAGEVVEKLIASDEGREVRQLAVLDAQGRVAAYTGRRCIPACGHIIGEGFSVQANMMSNERVWPAMKNAFENAPGPLAERMIAALEAAEHEGGDFRGSQSAAILVVKGKSSGKIWEDRAIDLRIEDHSSPVAELKRILGIQRAYESMNNGDLAIEKGDMASALAHYSKARAMYPDNAEMSFWSAATLASNGRLDEALPLLSEVFAKNPRWKASLPEMVKLGHIKLNDDQLKRIMSL